MNSLDAESFKDPEICKLLRFQSLNKGEHVPVNVNYLIKWLSEPLKYTTFRINRLRKNIDINKVRKVLHEQNCLLGCTDIPKVYVLKEDCLVIECWQPSDKQHKISAKQVIVDAPCGAAVLRGAHVFARGVMAMPGGLSLDEEVNVYADVQGTCKKGLKIEFNGKKRYVGTGLVKMLRHQIFDNNIQPSGAAIHITLPASNVPVINETIFDVGDVVLQNLPSIICGWVLNPKPGDRILDMCAAPGNKTTHLAELSNDQAQIFALDKVSSKVVKMKQKCLDHDMTCVQSYCYDSTKCFTSEKCIDDVSAPPFPIESMDKVLLDAPCSALGQRPLIYNKISGKTLKSYKFLQRQLFHAGIQVLKNDGKLVYSTCTVNQEENEDMVKWVLDKYPCMELVPAEPLLGGPGWSDVGLDDSQRSYVQRFSPENSSLRSTDEIYKDTVGFFIACFVKRRL